MNKDRAWILNSSPTRDAGNSKGNLPKLSIDEASRNLPQRLDRD